VIVWEARFCWNSKDIGCIRRVSTCGARFGCGPVNGWGYESQALRHLCNRPPEPAESAEFHAVLEDGQERYEKCFVPLRERAKQKEIELETDIVLGHPAEQIIHKADTIQASLIVMGKRSHTILHRWMLGSNSERVLRYAHCPVMIVH
jgi:nucleotide-binding universal stress UspA family protein